MYLVQIYLLIAMCHKMKYIKHEEITILLSMITAEKLW
jgi:hypothetical protein